MMNTSPYPRLLALLCIGCCAGLLQIEPTAAQVTFTNVSEEMGVEIATSYGVRTTALGDYDNDAKLDAFIVGGQGLAFFVLNNEGGGRFTNRLDIVPAAVDSERKGGGIVLGDYDNDGDLDVFVPTCCALRPSALLRNDRSTFTEVAEEAGLTDGLRTLNAIWLDYDRDGNVEVYVMNADGTNPVNLTNHPARDEEPDCSPDGLQILFTSNRDGNSEVYVMNADGSNPVNVTRHPGPDGGQPSWSPDGKHIAFSSGRDSNAEIYSIDISGSASARLDPAERENVFAG